MPLSSSASTPPISCLSRLKGKRWALYAQGPHSHLVSFRSQDVGEDGLREEGSGEDAIGVGGRYMIYPCVFVETVENRLKTVPKTVYLFIQTVGKY